jgi:proteasome lid subunit RPN8/RPN11
MITMDIDALRMINTQAIDIFPDECCGFLFGVELDNGERNISLVSQVNNAKEGDKRRRFEITGKDYMHAERFALENGLTLLGIYHSHPGHPAIPSEHDRVAAQPYFSYIIISVVQGSVDHIRSWRLNDASIFEEETFSTIHSNQSITWQQ